MADLFLELSELKVNGGVPTHTWWKAKVDVSLKVMPATDLMKKQLEKFWTKLSSKLTMFLAEYYRIVEYPISLFTCCKTPKIVSADGTCYYLVVGIVLSIESKKIRAANFQHVWSSQVRSKIRAGTRKSRAVLPSLKKEDREELRTYAYDGIPSSQFASFQSRIEKICDPIGTLILVSSVQTVGNLTICDKLLVPFFASCAKLIFPAIHLIPVCLWATMERFIAENQIDKDTMEVITKQAPLLSSLFQYRLTIQCEHASRIVMCRS